MKLRQKLAVVLATAMVVSAVPVVTMAGNIRINSNRSVRDGSLVGYTIDDSEDATTKDALTLKTANTSTGICYLKIAATGDANAETGKVSSMIIDLTDAELNWLAYAAASYSCGGEFDNVNDFRNVTVYEKDGKVYSGNTVIYNEKAEDAVKYEEILTYTNGNGGTAKIQLLGDKQIRVDFYGSWSNGSKTVDADELILPLFFKAKSTQVKVKVTGDDALFTDEEYTIGVKNEDGKELTVTADDAKTGIPYDGGEISKLILTEEIIGAIANSENQQIKLELPSSSDLEWKKSGIKAEGKKAFAGLKAEDLTAEYGTSGRNKDTDKQILIITLPNWSDATLKGVIELTGIKVEPVDDTAKLGELSITVSANDDDDFIKEKDIVVGVVNEYNVALTCDKPATVKAGRSAIVNKYDATVVLSEAVKDSLVTGRDIKFTLENGYIVGPADIDLSEDKAYDKSPKSSAYRAAALKAVQELVADEKIKFEEDAKVINKDKDAIKEVQVNTLGQVIGFTIDGEKLESGSDDDKRIDDGQRDEIKMKLPVAASLQATGEVKLVASGRAFTELGEEDEISCKIADIVSPVKVEMTAAELKVGLQDQKAGTLVISETDKGMFEKGTLIVDVNPEEEDGIKFQSVPKVEATNLSVSDVALSTNKKYLLIEVSKTSTEAGKITISDMKFTTDRTVPEGTFPVRFYGDALTDENVKTYSDEVWDKYVVNDFIKITTPNTEDIKNGALKAVTSKFTIGSNKYTVDGVEYEMDAPAYLKDNRTMVPVRYLAYAFGLSTENVTFANGTATIIAGEKVIQVKLGSNVLTVNGSPIQMDAKAELVDGRAYVPMKFIAVALGVSSSWDSATQTATFSNVAAK